MKCLHLYQIFQQVLAYLVYQSWYMSHCNQAYLVILLPRCTWESDTDARRNKSWPDLLCLGQVGLNFLLNDSGWSSISQIFLKKTQTHFFVRIHPIKKLYIQVVGVWCSDMIVVRFCWSLDKSVPGSSWVSVTYQVKRQPKHDSSDSLTCRIQSVKSSVCPASSILSPIALWGLSLATLTLLISALHQCPVCLCAIGQSSLHGTLISLTSSIDPHCETVRRFDLSEPTQILTYKQAWHKHWFVRY